MAQSAAIELLLKERYRLRLEQDAAWDKMQEAIDQIEVGIESLSGKKVWEIQKETVYDDENPTYIQNTEDGI